MRLTVALAAQLVLMGAPPFRLPAEVKPIRYELDLTVDPRMPNFGGSVRIEAELKARTKLIRLHAKDLIVESASVITGSRRRDARALIEDEFLGLQLPEEVGPGRATLTIAFKGSMPTDRNNGLYRKNAGEDWYAFTTFTPIDARRAFPCFDEPGYKTPWRIALHVPRADVAASNWPARSERDESGGLKRIEFDETAPLPSEVVAIAVGPFDVVKCGSAGRNRVPVRVLAPKGRGAEAAGACEGTPPVLAKLEEYTGIPYPWAKLDHVAVLDMPFGAVENPGLITYRDRGLLAKAATDTSEWRFRMRGTMAHELAHQWFGNLVTQAWWDDVWLSEGFATWLGGKVSDEERPPFERGLAPVAARIRIMRTDESANSRPVRLAMNSRKDTEGVYSRFVYDKAAAILYMLEHWLGEDKFRDGLRAYLKRHANGNATTHDLAVAVGAASGADVEPVLSTFLDRPGFPILLAACVDGHPRVNGTAGWSVPVCPKGAGCAVISERSAELPGSCAVAAEGLNREGSGYFVVDRGESGFETIMKSAGQGWPAAGRLNLVSDVATLARRNQLSADTLRRLLPTLIGDPEPAVSNAAYRLLVTLVSSAQGSERAKWDAVLDALARGTSPRR